MVSIENSTAATPLKFLTATLVSFMKTPLNSAPCFFFHWEPFGGSESHPKQKQGSLIFGLPCNTGCYVAGTTRLEPATTGVTGHPDTLTSL